MMKSNIRYLSALMVAASALLSGCVTDKDELAWSLAVGDLLPSFSVETVDGRVLTTDALWGSVTVLVFFNTSCQDCRSELPRVQTVYDRMRAGGGQVELVCISRQEGRESVMTYWEEHGFTLPVAPQEDRSVYEKFASSGIPRIYVADKSGIITTVFSDSHLPSVAEIEDAVNACH